MFHFLSDLGMNDAHYPLERKGRADPSVTPGSVFPGFNFWSNTLVAPTPFLTTSFKSDKPSILKKFLFAISGSGETLCSLFPWIPHVLYKIGIFLPRTATQGGFGLFLDTGSIQWFHHGLKAHEQSYCTFWCYSRVFLLSLEIGKPQIFSVGFQTFYKREKLIWKVNGST